MNSAGIDNGPPLSEYRPRILFLASAAALARYEKAKS